MNQALRIALYHNLPSGGAKRAVYEWTRRLAATHKIDVYTLSSADHDFCDIRPFVQEYRVFDFTPHRLFESPWGRLNQLQRWRDLGELTRIGRCIAHEVNTGSYDVVFAQPCFYTFIPAFLRFVQIPSVYYVHEPFGPMDIRQFQRPYFQDNKWREILNRFDPSIRLYNQRLNKMRLESIRQTKQFLANSKFTQQRMKVEFNVDAPVCYYGVDCERFRPIDINKENYVISVGELTPRKGFDFIVESLAHIPSDKRPGLKLVCNIESLPERIYVEELAAHRNVRLQVLLNMNSEQLALEYNKAQLCVYAPVLEPFGLVPLESMACGTPVVGVCEGGVSESIVHERTGLLVERDYEQFARAVQHLLSNPTLASEYGRNGREHVLCNWTWGQVVATLESYLAACARMG